MTKRIARIMIWVALVTTVAGCGKAGPNESPVYTDTARPVLPTAITEAPSPTNTSTLPALSAIQPTPTVTMPTATQTLRPTVTESPLPPLDGRGGGVFAYDLYNFLGSEGGTRDLYVMNADESGQRRLMKNYWDDFDPAWSPDGTRIAFTSDRNGNMDIFVLTVEDALQSASNTIEWQLTSSDADDGSATWSPDGSQIAFESDREGNWELYVINVDGSDLRRLTDNAATDRAPDWSPDGSRIAFESTRDGGSEIYVMEADGSNPQRLTDNQAADHGPSWSPDGSRIAFYSTIEGGWEIFVMSIPQGSDTNIGSPTRLTNIGASSSSPDWSPDGSQIAFILHLAGANPGLYIMNADGTNQRFLPVAAGSYTLAWRPAVPSPIP